MPSVSRIGGLRIVRPVTKSISLTNLVPNGNFPSATTGWQHYSNFSTESIVSGELKSLKDGTRPYVGTSGTWNIATGHKLYCTAKAYANKSGAIYAGLFGTFALNDAGYFGIYPTTTKARASAVITTATYTVNGIFFDGQSYTSNGDYIMLDDVLVIDLTAAFGAGLEPTAAQMDMLLEQFSGQWFDGTVTATYDW